MFFHCILSLAMGVVPFALNREDTITTTFCGSKKSLVHGSLFMMVLGISDDNKVMFLLPIMLYHSFQLFYVSWLANKLSGNR
nr:bile acid:sodium symporter [Capnocytophaga ochracea]